MLLTECGSDTTQNCSFGVHATIKAKNITTSDNEGTLVS
jgi:hypothetical protein